MPQDGDRPARVAIIGASLAGMFAAAACVGEGRRVVVLERDVLPPHPVPRPGVPQGHQPHIVLHRGLLALEDLLPGVGADLHAAGALTLDTGDLAWLAASGWAPYRRPSFHILSVTRPLLEHVVRSRVLALPGVELRAGSRVESLARTESSAVWQLTTADGDATEADLLIDASGRSSRLPAWLRELGWGAVRVTEVDARVGYATRAYAVPPETVEPAGVVVLQTPATLAGGLALPVEGGRWLVAAVGSGPRRPPRDAEGFDAFLNQLADPAVAEVAAQGSPVGEVRVHRQTANRRHHYERLRPWPTGLLVMGDALCAFNPVYGQGITVAASQALALRDALRADRHPLGRRLQRRFSGLAAVPWAIATSEDVRLPTSDGRQPVLQRLPGEWAQELGRLAAHGDERAATAMARVYHLMAPPWALWHPALVAASLRARLVGCGPANPRPPILRAPGPLAKGRTEARVGNVRRRCDAEDPYAPGST